MTVARLLKKVDQNNALYISLNYTISLQTVLEGGIIETCEHYTIT